MFWVLTFAALTLLCPETNYNAFILLPVFGMFQMIERRILYFHTHSGQVAALLAKLSLSYLLIGYTHGLDSVYAPILLLPVIASATRLDLWKTVTFTALACAAYPSFLLFLNLKEVPAEAIRILCIRVVFFMMAGFLVFEEASAKRRESQRALRAEAALQRSERIAALSQLTAGLAHELRNPIATVKASAEMLMRPGSQSDPGIVSEISGYIVSEIDRTASLISRFLDFAAPLVSRPERNDLSMTVESVFEDLRELASASGVHLRKNLRRGQVLFAFDAQLIQLALFHLVKNAIEASAPGQGVILHVEEHDAEISISVSDKGSGIDPRHRESIFNPFFTTKAAGLGLGLATASKAVQVCQGRIDVTYAPGPGTTFRISLPR